MPLKALGWRFNTLSFESREDTRKWVLQLCGLMIWTKKTILIPKDGCNVSAVVQHTSHSLTRASWVTAHTWTDDVKEGFSGGASLKWEFGSCISLYLLLQITLKMELESCIP